MPHFCRAQLLHNPNTNPRCLETQSGIRGEWAEEEKAETFETSAASTLSHRKPANGKINRLTGWQPKYSPPTWKESIPLQQTRRATSYARSASTARRRRLPQKLPTE